MSGILDHLWSLPGALLALFGATLTALGRIVRQAHGFLESTFTGPAGQWLLAATGLLAAAAAVAYARSRLVAPAVRTEWRRGLSYYAGLAFCLGALAAVVAAWRATGPPAPGQTPVAVILLAIAAGHVLWFGADLCSRAPGMARTRRLVRRIHANRTAYYMVIPTVVLVGTFLYLPALSIFYYSGFQYDMGGTMKAVGLGNYRRLLDDPIMWKSLGNMATLTTLGVCLHLVVPLLVAELIFHLRTERVRYYLRAAFVIPMVVPGVVMYLIWQYLYSDAGLVALTGHLLGLGDGLEGLLSRPGAALYAVIFVGFPFVSGISLLIFYAGLGSIEESVWEAARLDGARPLRRFFSIDLPLLMRQLKLLLILGIIGGVQSFENVLVMTQGGPGWQTMLPGLYMYRSAMSFNEYGYACSVGVTLFLIVLAVSLAVNRGVPTTRT